MIATVSTWVSKARSYSDAWQAGINWKEEFVKLLHRCHLYQIRAERLAAKILHPRRPLVLATACWSFPIYSQSFVYQELTQLKRNGFQLRFLYSKLNGREQLPGQFNALWRARRKLFLHPVVYTEDYAYFVQRMPVKIERLVELLSQASGLSAHEVRSHYHFMQAFSFTRLVEAYRPDYLHSYFFYEGSLFTFIASYLLGIPRGVSCYADHMLTDYVLKVVPLHLEQCRLAVATSRRIKQELMQLAPGVDPHRILVKPNGVNSAKFPVVKITEPKMAQPYRLVCVSRIEPKKGLVYLVEAVRALRDRKWNVELHLLGGVDDSASSRDYAGQLEACIRAHKLEGIVHLEGRKSESDIKRFFHRSHLFVAPFIETESGDKDGIPTSVLEAMASGLPVIGTDAGSIPEVIEHGHDGLIVQQRDPHALVQAIAELLSDRARRIQLGRNAAAKVRSTLDASVCEPLLRDQLIQLLATLDGSSTAAISRSDSPVATPAAMIEK